MIDLTQEEITRNWGVDDSDNPLVSIKCMTYNHENYIAQCIDGFLMQKTNFPFEILIHDDCSTDKTESIVREYEKRFPKIIKGLYETENQWQKGCGAHHTKIDAAIKGKYIALCEGDDYWIDENKLQMQVDFLENNPEYTMCFHNAIEHYEDGSVSDKQFSQVENRDYSGIEFFKHWIVPTASVIYKKEITESDFYKKIKEDRNLIFGDTPLFLTSTKYGRVRGFSNTMVVYRRQINGASYGINLKRDYLQYFHNKTLGKYFPKIKKYVKINNMKLLGSRCAYCLLNKNALGMDFFKLNPIICIILTPLYLLKFLKNPEYMH